MDLTKALQPALNLISAALPGLSLFCIVLLIIWICKTRWFKGWFGEKFISFWFRRSLAPALYHICDDVMLPTDDGTTQIDHIIVSPFGIFVVETKNWKGWLFGSEKQAQWTRQYYRSKKKIQNPLRQNHKHVLTLAEETGLSREMFHSLIVFVGDCELKTEMPENVTRGARPAVRFILSQTEKILTDEEVQRTLKNIAENRLENTRKSRRQHVRHVEDLKARKQDHSYCPRCGGELVVKTVSKGARKGNQFMGCRKYPKCQGTREITT